MRKTAGPGSALRKTAGSAENDCGSTALVLIDGLLEGVEHSSSPTSSTPTLAATPLRPSGEPVVKGGDMLARLSEGLEGRYHSRRSYVVCLVRFLCRKYQLYLELG